MKYSFDQLVNDFRNRSTNKKDSRFKGIDESMVNAVKTDMEILLEKNLYNREVGMSYSTAMNMVRALHNGTLEEQRERGQFNESFVLPDGRAMSLTNIAKEAAQTLNEDFNGTAQGVAPTPRLNAGVVTSTYQSILPFIASIHEMSSPTEKVYYTKFISDKTLGDITKNDVLQSPKDVAKQSSQFASGRVFGYALGTTTAGDGTYTVTAGNAPIVPGTLVVRIAGQTGFFYHENNGGNAEAVVLTPTVATLGAAVANLRTGVISIDLTTAPAGNGLAITADYARDLETSDASANVPEVSLSIDAVDLKATVMSVAINSTFALEQMLNATYGLSASPMLEKTLGDLANRDITNNIIKGIDNGLGVASKFNYDMATGTGTDNRLFNAKMIPYVIENIMARISAASGQNANKLSTLVAEQSLRPIFAGADSFKGIDGANIVSNGACLMGKINNIPIVLMPDSQILGEGQAMGLLKAEDQLLAPAIVGDYAKPYIATIPNFDNLNRRKHQLLAMVAPTVVAPNLAAKATFVNYENIGGGAA